MKSILILLILFASSTTFGQLYTVYIKQGIGKSTGGSVSYKNQLLLNADNSFNFFQNTYRQDQVVSSDSSSGKWMIDGKILKLDFTPQTIDPSKPLDTYLIRKKSLKRTTYKDERAIYKASGVLLKSSSVN